MTSRLRVVCFNASSEVPVCAASAGAEPETGGLSLCWSPAGYELSHKCSGQYPLGKCWQADSTFKEIFNGLVIKCIKIHQQTTTLSMLENSLFSDFSLPCSLWGYSYKTQYEMLPALVVIHRWKWPHSSEGRRIKISQRWLCAKRGGMCARQAVLSPPTSSTQRRHWYCPKMVLSLARGCSFFKTPTTDLAVNSVGVKPN